MARPLRSEPSYSSINHCKCITDYLMHLLFCVNHCKCTIFLFFLQASCNPVAYSLLADFFPEKNIAFALSVYHYGVYLGKLIEE